MRQKVKIPQRSCSFNYEKEEEPVNTSLNLPEGGRAAIHNDPHSLAKDLVCTMGPSSVLLVTEYIRDPTSAAQWMDGSRRLNDLSSTNAAQWMNENKKVNELSSIRVSEWMDDDRTIMSSHCLKVIPCPGSFCQKVIKVVSTIPVVTMVQQWKCCATHPE